MPPGYLDECVSAGTIEDGTLLLSDEAFEFLRRKYSSGGLGDRVHDFLAPAVAVADKVLGTNLANCGGCKSRREWLNQHFPNP